MSVGLNGMSDQVQSLHNTLHQFREPVGRYTYPQNTNQRTICKALMMALRTAHLNSGLVLMIVHDKEFNYGDHHQFRMEMLRNGRRAEPVTMQQLIDKMVYSEETGIASLDGQPIDAFYFRTGYTMGHFPTQSHWTVRQQIEKSRSIKLPSIEMILINSKRMQSEIAK